MKKKWIITSIVAAVVVAGVIVTPLIAEEVSSAACPMKKMFANTPLGRLFTAHIGRAMLLKAKLNVSDEQHQKLHDIVASNKSDILKVATPLIEKKQALVDAVLADTPDEKAIRAAADELGKAIGDAAILASKMARQAKGVLTPEQISVIKDHQAQSRQDIADFLKQPSQEK